MGLLFPLPTKNSGAVPLQGHYTDYSFFLEYEIWTGLGGMASLPHLMSEASTGVVPASEGCSNWACWTSLSLSLPLAFPSDNWGFLTD